MSSSDLSVSSEVLISHFHNVFAFVDFTRQASLWRMKINKGMKKGICDIICNGLAANIRLSKEGVKMQIGFGFNFVSESLW